MEVHLPGLVWAAAAFVSAGVAWVLPDPPPPRHVLDKYLHVPSTFPTHLSNKGLHRSMTGLESGMSRGMQPYSIPGVRPPQRSMKTMARKLALAGVVFSLMAVLSPLNV